MSATRMDDGQATRLEFSLAPGVWIWQKELTPPGVDAGGEIDTTTFENTAWRTRWPKKLKTGTPVTLVAAYSPASYTTILSILGQNQLLTVRWPDGDGLAFWGWVNLFQPGSHTEGNQPTATVNVIPSNQNNSKVETPPVLV